MELPAAGAIRSFRARVWAHHRAHRRAMPWRETREPWRILVSEVMLQQTQVDRVRPKYEAFVAAFRNAGALAVAPLDRKSVV
jgi:A/G-specific adenine glycosylase